MTQLAQVSLHTMRLRSLPYPQVDEVAMKLGLEEAVKWQINLVADAVNNNLTQQMEPRMKDYQTLIRKAESAGVDVRQYQEKYESIIGGKSIT